jgi:hypothetical protein
MQGANALVVSNGAANAELSLPNQNLIIFSNLANGNAVTTDETGTGTFSGTGTAFPLAENANAAASAPGGSASGFAFGQLGRTIQNVGQSEEIFQFQVDYSLFASVTDDLPGETGEAQSSIDIFDITTPGSGVGLFSGFLFADQNTAGPLTIDDIFASSPVVLLPGEEFRVQINIQSGVSAFSPQSQPPSVPEPAALLLMGLGLAGLGFAKRKLNA